MRVLIAEDEAISRKLLHDSLLGWGYDVVVTRDGKEAMKVLEQEERPSLAVLDWMMPEVDGIELCRWLRSSEQLDYVYVIMLTARNNNGDMVRGLEAGADDYMVKPFDQEELKYRLRIGERIIAQEQKIRRLASTDDLTGLLTRRAFRERMEATINRAEPNDSMGIIIGDIDHFKQVNDTYGHLAGDKVLQYFANCLSSACRLDNYIGRYGGEEFIIGVPGATLGETAEIAERIRRLVQDTCIYLDNRNETIRITASFGVGALVFNAADDNPADQIINRADEALYKAKNRGRNCTEVFSAPTL